MDEPVGEVYEPELKQIALTDEEQQLYGSTLMGLIDAGLQLKRFESLIKPHLEDEGFDTLDAALAACYTHAVMMQRLVDVQLEKAGLKAVIG
jgi:hypothetical protein